VHELPVADLEHLHEWERAARSFAKANNEAVPLRPDQDVYVLVLHGDLTCHSCSRPAGTPAPKGRTMAALVLERQTLRLLEFGFGGRLDVRLLGGVQTLALP
jgi:hypothetical protein